jgi:UDP-N-acetylglucosamine--N-acetylmuramyl-(pentapeptide) pyrophosphoryl-undecaprenol N-acetylglucosamine transferase
LKHNPNILLSGGGTGGHIFPAIAIADALKKIYPQAKFLFVGAEGRMEMEKVPTCGYEIIGIPIAGLQRSMSPMNLLKNSLLPFKLIFSFIQVFSIIRKFNPDIAIGTGGYASGPTLKMAQWLGVPTVIQEQNALPGYTNRILGMKTKCAFVSFENTKSYFPNSETVYTGNAIRESFADEIVDKKTACEFFNLSEKKPTVFVTGGSLGAKAINEALANNFQKLIDEDIQILWQCGKSHFNRYKSFENDKCRVLDFISNMNMAYGAADIIVTRAGGALFEMFVIGKPIIAMPSPYVAEDHQTKNAEELVQQNAAILIQDKESNQKLVPTIIELLHDKSKMSSMHTSIKSLAKPYAASEIANKIKTIIELNQK